jgi:DNA-binding PadR family transcriptional regulator
MRHKENEIMKDKESIDDIFQLSSREKLVLIALDRKELYGLQITKVIEEVTEGKQRISIGMLYPIFHEFEKKDLIESRWGEESIDNRGGARRRYYKLTKTGITTLNSILSTSMPGDMVFA